MLAEKKMLNSYNLNFICSVCCYVSIIKKHKKYMFWCLLYKSIHHGSVLLHHNKVSIIGVLDWMEPMYVIWTLLPWFWYFSLMDRYIQSGAQYLKSQFMTKNVILYSKMKPYSVYTFNHSTLFVQPSINCDIVTYNW